MARRDGPLRLRLTPSFIAGGCLLISTFWLGSCSPEKTPNVQKNAYGGPAIALDSTGPQHHVILTAPTAGWSFTLDETRRELYDTQAYFTARRPNPAFMHAQVRVTLEVATPIDASRPIYIFARVVSFDEMDSSEPYSPVTPATPSTPPPAPASCYGM